MIFACPFCDAPFATIQTPYGRAELSACEKCGNPVVINNKPDLKSVAPVPGARDIREDCPPKSVGAEILAALGGSESSLPVLPETAAMLWRTHDSAWDDVPGWVVEADPALVAHVLARANGELYGGLDKVEDVPAAVHRIGNEALAAALGELAALRPFDGRFPRILDVLREQRRHALYAALAARAIARELLMPDPGALYAAALLHDAGKSWLYGFAAAGTTPAMAAVRDSAVLLDELVGRFHPLAGLRLVQRWRLPGLFRLAVFCHHNPERVPEERDLLAVHVVSLANMMAHAAGHGGRPSQPVSLLTHPSNRYLGLSDVRLAAIRVDTDDAFAALLAGFQGRSEAAETRSR